MPTACAQRATRLHTAEGTHHGLHASFARDESTAVQHARLDDDLARHAQQVRLTPQDKLLHFVTRRVLVIVEEPLTLHEARRHGGEAPGVHGVDGRWRRGRCDAVAETRRRNALAQLPWLLRRRHAGRLRRLLPHIGEPALAHLDAVLLFELLAEGRSDDGDGEREDDDTEEHRQDAHGLPQPGRRVQVAVTHRRHRSHAPVHGLWNRVERRARAAWGDVLLEVWIPFAALEDDDHGTKGDHLPHDGHEQHRERHPATSHRPREHQHHLHRLGRFEHTENAGEAHDAHDAEHFSHAVLAAHEEREERCDVPRQDRHQIEQVERI
mmetsp:Transcript_18391/g.47097  ORF Transcript_18391/g.47097 Transcript_18391/m.47097 type:complete len:324 (+) Transcript_18391:720-1691(+)